MEYNCDDSINNLFFSFIRNKLILIFKAKFKYFPYKKEKFLRHNFLFFLFSGKYLISLSSFKKF